MIYNGIFWERDFLIESHGHANYYYATGEDEQGNQFEGQWLEINGEFEEVTEIEKLI